MLLLLCSVLVDTGGISVANCMFVIVVSSSRASGGNIVFQGQCTRSVAGVVLSQDVEEGDSSGHREGPLPSSQPDSHGTAQEV